VSSGNLTLSLFFRRGEIESADHEAGLPGNMQLYLSRRKAPDWLAPMSERRAFVLRLTRRAMVSEPTALSPRQKRTTTCRVPMLASRFVVHLQNHVDRHF